MSLDTKVISLQVVLIWRVSYDYKTNLKVIYSCLRAKSKLSWNNIVIDVV